MRGLCGETADVVGSLMAIQAYSHSDVLDVVGMVATRIGGRWRQVEFMCQEKKVTNSTYDVCRN